MVKMASYVFMDLETTGLPYQERNRTKITELSFVAVLRKDLEEAAIGSRPYTSKLTLLLNPGRKINPTVEVITGITNKIVQNAPIFKEKTDSILSFLKELPKPVCLVAHNGNNFDFKILLTEFADINMSLPGDLLCVDSLVGYRKMHKQKYPRISKVNDFSFEDSRGSEDWPDLDISPEDWNEIDTLCSSFSDIDFNPSQESVCSSPINGKKEPEVVLSFKLPDLYKRLLKKEAEGTHRAEADCLMLLDCVVASKEFLIWTDKYCKSICDIKPLQRG